MSTPRKPAVRICASCKHCTQHRVMFIIPAERCAHPRAVDIVTGKPVWDARTMRSPGSRLCGPAGRLWEAAAPTVLADPADDVVRLLMPLRPRQGGKA